MALELNVIVVSLDPTPFIVKVAALAAFARRMVGLVVAAAVVLLCLPPQAAIPKSVANENRQIAIRLIIEVPALVIIASGVTRRPEKSARVIMMVLRRVNND